MKMIAHAIHDEGIINMGLLIGICGLAGSGKDTVADHLVANHKFTKISLADPLKRICKQVFNFSDQQLWGPSQFRNEPDPNWPQGDGFLTPRYALQRLGTEWGRDCSPDVWVRYALQQAIDLMSSTTLQYTSQRGLHSSGSNEYFTNGVVIPDVRFGNEVEAIKKAGGIVWKITRDGAGLEGSAGQHASEQEMQKIDHRLFSLGIRNNSSKEALFAVVDALMSELSAVEAREL